MLKISTAAGSVRAHLREVCCLGSGGCSGEGGGVVCVLSLLPVAQIPAELSCVCRLVPQTLVDELGKLSGIYGNRVTINHFDEAAPFLTEEPQGKVRTITTCR